MGRCIYSLTFVGKQDKCAYLFNFSLILIFFFFWAAYESVAEKVWHHRDAFLCCHLRYWHFIKILNAIKTVNFVLFILTWDLWRDCAPDSKVSAAKPLEEFFKSRWPECAVGAYSHLNSEDTQTAAENYFKHKNSTFRKWWNWWNYRCDIKRL